VSRTVAVHPSAAPLAAPAENYVGVPVATSADFRPQRVTWSSILADTLSWTGLDSSLPGIPVPDAPVPDLIAGLWTAVRRVHYTFFNSAPTLNPTAYSEDPTTGVITGDLGGADADGDVLTYTITSEPTHGTLAVADNGTYTYTPDLATSHSGGTDSFVVGVSDTSTANPWHVRPVSDLIAGFTQVLSGFGLATPVDPATATVVVTATPITSSRKPGWIQSTQLTVNYSSESWGDEPVMVTTLMEVTLGVSGSTRVKVVNESPGQLGSGVKAGQTIDIPGSDGNVWLDNSKPLSVADIDAAADTKSAIPIPVVVIATLMLEGDLTAGYLIGKIGSDEMASKLSRLGKALEAVSVSSLFNAPKAIADALPQITDAVAITGSNIGGAIALRIAHWVVSASDPDDPIGLSMTVLVPCDSSMKDLVDTISNLFPELGLDKQGLRNDVVKVRVDPAGVPLWTTDVSVRSGFLLPQGSLPDGPATWTTEYVGQYAGDNARYTVQTTAKPY
jgi:hypothetical protein